MDPDHLKLGKGVPFVKSQLRRLPQGDDLWEADFMWALNPMDPRAATVWRGLVVHREGWIVAETMVDQPPTVNAMGTLLADAMRRPCDEEPRRPQTIRLRLRREWQELHPHLVQLGIEVIAARRLAKWDKAFHEACRQAAKGHPDVPPSPLEAVYPSVARFVRTQGWIEVGDQEGVGFIARALDCGGMVFASKTPKTFAEAMAALEKGLGKFLKDQG
jgi:hypothetical protein